MKKQERYFMIFMLIFVGLMAILPIVMMCITIN